MTDQEKDSSDNLARRYRRLFRLPSMRKSIVFASIPTLLVELIARSVLGGELAGLLVYAILAELTLLLTVGFDRQLLKRQSSVGTYRRLVAISIMSNSLWLAVAVVSLLSFLVTHSETRFAALMIVGMFFAVSFRALIFGSVFYGNTVRGLPLSLVQPFLLAIPIMYSPTLLSENPLPIISAVLIGLVYVSAAELYLRSINNTAPIGGQKPLQLFQSFLNAWILEDATKMENVLDKVSKPIGVSTGMIKIGENSDGKSVLLVVPGIHPGPFYPVGSSNLPADIYSKLRSPEVIPLTVHSISDHELNLPSKSEVENYVGSLREAKQIDHGVSMSTPVVRKQGKATVTGIVFGLTCLIAITQAPYGMEDFPVKVRMEIESRANAAGFKLALVIDTHNSEGQKPNEAECEDAIVAATATIEELAKSKRNDIKVGFAHSSELDTSVPKDIGPAGLGLLVFEVENNKFCFVIVDANNSKIGFREDVFREFEKETGTKILELCTSDTHVTAAKTSGAKGYLALGDMVSVDAFTKILSSLYEKANSRIGPGSYSSMSVTSQVKTIGSEILREFSGIMDQTSATAKRGAEILSVLGILVIIIAAIL
ncbi:MAG: DUF2070 family protein [Nitrososphaerales archaeon]